MCPGKVLCQNSENLVTGVIMFWKGMCVRILKYQFHFLLNFVKVPEYNRRWFSIISVRILSNYIFDNDICLIYAGKQLLSLESTTEKDIPKSLQGNASTVSYSSDKWFPSSPFQCIVHSHATIQC